MIMSEKTDFEAKPVRLLGDPALRLISREVTDFSNLEYIENARNLHAALFKFRREHGFGRAISAPQIGIPQRFIALNLGNEPQLLVNPAITRRSEKKFTMWDDCMSFPGILVRLERHESISVRFQDENGNHREWENLDTAVSELLQHEIDHLDGILAIDRAIDKDSLILREYFEQNREEVNRLVDYTIY